LKGNTTSEHCTIDLNSQDESLALLGQNGAIRRLVQKHFNVRIVDRGTQVTILGEESAARSAQALLSGMLDAVRKGYSLTLKDFEYALGTSAGTSGATLGNLLSEKPAAIRSDVQVRPRTAGQRMYLDMIYRKDITLVTGPAGTGKTYLAMAVAVSALLNRQVRRLVLTRPAVEAGERLGFLPGDLTQKVNPYLRPLYDALYSMVDMDRVERFIDQEAIEVAPLAFMRGRTLDHSFVILDEAQNTTPEQMMMFLTRLGQASKMVVTGDITQIDLPRGIKSGLIDAQEILQDIDGIGMVQLSRGDVVRNPLVQKVVTAYENRQRSEKTDSAIREDDKE
jgi:phosphate starvation-inducible PhoH-like protein